jgi:hypothetical protein
VDGDRRAGARAAGTVRWPSGLSSGFVALVLLCGLALPEGYASATRAPAASLFAYAGGQAVAPPACPASAVPVHQCTLAQALRLAQAGSTIDLATPGKSAVYVGNWNVLTAGTSTAAPLTLRPAPGAQRPVLGGNGGLLGGCGTPTCDGAVLTIGHHVHLDLMGITIRNADNTASGLGGAIANTYGGTVTVVSCYFRHDYANASGGAIDNAGTEGSGTLAITGSRFVSNSSVNSDGGAIANADVGGRGKVSISSSTFVGNSAINGDGGAIDNGDTHGTGTLTVTSSSFLGNVAGRAGAIDNADNATATLEVTGSQFTGNVAAIDDGGAIDNADWGGTGTVVVTGSTFSANKTIGNGGGIDNADSMATSRGLVEASLSTFSGNIAEVHGGALADADTGRGTLELWASTLSANKANDIYATPGDHRGGDSVSAGPGGTVWAAADIFNAPCRMGGGTWEDKGYNIGDGTTCLRNGRADVGHGADRLGRLAANGGPTKTILPLVDNPAVSAIPYRTHVLLGRTQVTLCPAPDQRGHTPSGDHRCDVGAVQSQVAG